MPNKFNAQRCWWHPTAGYFYKKEDLEEYYLQNKPSLLQAKIGIDDFTVFDSKFEAGIHNTLYQFVAKYPNLRLFTQIQVDLSCNTFCKLGYKIDFLITEQTSKKGFQLKTDSVIKPLVKDRGLKCEDIIYRPDINRFNFLLIEAKGFFGSEARYKHLLLEWRGFVHGKSIEIVQLQPQYVSKGTKCYKTLTPVELLDKLNQRYSIKRE